MFLLLVAVAVAWFAVIEPQTSQPSAGPDQARVTPSAAPRGSSAQTAAERALPAEGRAMIAAIDAGGPFTYDRDGAVFQNRERHLPAHRRGYWREYTVRTPGANDRGARRLVEGEAGEMYYTDDHYRSFRQVRAAGDRS